MKSICSISQQKERLKHSKTDFPYILFVFITTPSIHQHSYIFLICHLFKLPKTNNRYLNIKLIGDPSNLICLIFFPISAEATVKISPQYVNVWIHSNIFYILFSRLSQIIKNRLGASKMSLLRFFPFFCIYNYSTHTLIAI